MTKPYREWDVFAVLSYRASVVVHARTKREAIEIFDGNPIFWEGVHCDTEPMDWRLITAQGPIEGPRVWPARTKVDTHE